MLTHLPLRFWNKVAVTPKCWLWTGAVSHGGYGYFGNGSRRSGISIVHRLAYRCLVNELTGHIDHLCREKLCVNPLHLEDVTQAENNRRAAAARTSCRHGHPLVEYRNHYGKSHRWCRTCHRERRKGTK